MVEASVLQPEADLAAPGPIRPLVQPFGETGSLAAGAAYDVKGIADYCESMHDRRHSHSNYRHAHGFTVNPEPSVAYSGSGLDARVRKLNCGAEPRYAPRSQRIYDYDEMRPDPGYNPCDYLSRLNTRKSQNTGEKAATDLSPHVSPEESASIHGE